MKIAVLITSHNRIDKTLNCLNYLYKASLPLNCYLEIFLVDDASTDGTSKAVKDSFPKVNIIRGDGSLYWNQGMRLAWKASVVKNIPDFFLWLNDDTNIDDDAFLHLFECNSEYISNNSKEVIVVGSCRDNNNVEKFSYGLRRDNVKIIPNGEIQKGNLLNGNLVLISKTIYSKLGNLSNDYTHAMGDHDYGLRALNNGFEIITTKKYVATCSTNSSIPKWRDSKESLINRWIALHTPKGLNIKEYKIFIKKFWPKKYIPSILKVYLRCLMPNLYNKISHYEK